MKKKYIILITTFLSFIIITGFLLLLNDVIIYIRLNELRSQLHKEDVNSNSMDNIGLIAKYQISKDIFEKKISQEKADRSEAEIISMIQNIEKNDYVIPQIKYKFVSKPALLLINFNRMIIGKTPLSFFRPAEDMLPDLDAAYYYERNFIFDRAISLYEKILKEEKIDDSLRASILLHQGYCYALSGKNDRAIKNYVMIIYKFSSENENSAVTAVILYRYLEGFKLARERVVKGKQDPLAVSRDLVDLMAYEQALGMLDELESKAGPGGMTTVKYLKAKCYAGTGNAEKAVDNFLQVINSSPDSEYARKSNRQLFLIGARSNEKNIIKAAEKLNTKINDPVLTDMIRKQEYTVTDDALTLEKVEISDDTQKKIDKIISEKIQIKKTIPYYEIVTSDGNTFKGYLIEKNEEVVSLQTSIGRVDVKRERITRISISE